MADAEPNSSRRGRLGAVAVVAVAAFALGAGSALLGQAPEVVFLTSELGYEPAARPWVHGVFVAVNLIGFGFVAIGAQRLTVALARRGWLFFVGGAGLLLAGLGASFGAAAPELVGVRGEDRALLGVIGPLFTAGGGFVLAIGWRARRGRSGPSARDGDDP